MDSPDGWPQFLNFLRDWVFVPAVLVIGWLWKQISDVRKDQDAALQRIEISIAGLAEAFNQHALDDLRRFASKEDLSIVRADVGSLRSHMDERFDRLGQIIGDLGRPK